MGVKSVLQQIVHQRGIEGEEECLGEETGVRNPEL